jgi:hypothetical protein
MINEEIYVIVLWLISEIGRARLYVKCSVVLGQCGMLSPLSVVYVTLMSYRVYVLITKHIHFFR